ncbi:hypothetical protein ACQ4M4_21595 [Leptolyngbya sp. AN02str]|uniref:hypothetical protein n=1 Tax=Leptolyngbya sp. AN02str TaxID=3423363 RepID=UPI003D30FE9F
MVIALSAVILLTAIVLMSGLALVPLYLLSLLHLPAWIGFGVVVTLFFWCMHDESADGL